MWNPKKVASRMTSRHHCAMVRAMHNKLKKNRDVLCLWNQITIPIVILKALIAPQSGQGLMSTR